jgi:hypothetical protein
MSHLMHGPVHRRTDVRELRVVNCLDAMLDSRPRVNPKPSRRLAMAPPLDLDPIANRIFTPAALPEYPAAH